MLSTSLLKRPSGTDSKELRILPLDGIDPADWIEVILAVERGDQVGSLGGSRAGRPGPASGCLSSGVQAFAWP